jgi:hypothetical protein
MTMSRFGGLRIDDWVKLSCGDRVCRRDDPRHEGRVEAIWNSAFVKVRREFIVRFC